MNIHRYGASYLRKLLRRQLESRKMFKTFIEFAEIVLAQGGRVHFEWPSHCQGWRLVEPKISATDTSSTWLNVTRVHLAVSILNLGQLQLQVKTWQACLGITRASMNLRLSMFRARGQS